MPERRAWTTEEDKILKHLKEDLQIVKWSAIARRMADDHNMPDRTGKQCRQRYHNHLDSTILRTQWTPEEEQHLYKLHDEIGNKWAIIAQKLPGRTDNCVKNHFYSKMRKAIRKLNKIIYQYYKKEIKQIKMTVLYKIVQATDQRFKTNPNVQEETSDKCCKLKNVLLMYSNDGNQLQNDIEKIGQMAREIHQFSSRYRRKAKKTRRSSAQGPDLLKIPKFQPKIKTTSDCQQDDSQYSMVISHGCDDDEQSFQIDQQIPSKRSLQPIKQVDDLKQSINSQIIPKMNQINLLQSPPSINVMKPMLIKPPPLIKPPNIFTNFNINQPKTIATSIIQSGDKVEQFLRNKGIVENQVDSPMHHPNYNHFTTSHGHGHVNVNFNANANIRAPPTLKQSSLADSIHSIDSDHHHYNNNNNYNSINNYNGNITNSINIAHHNRINSVNFLSQSIQKMGIVDMSMNIDIEPDQEHKLFVSN